LPIAFLGCLAIIAAEKQKSVTNANTLLDAFENAAKQRGIFGERIIERCLTSFVPDVLIDHARLHDLTIIPIVPVANSIRLAVDRESGDAAARCWICAD
jgi:hypothetical protein